jgi:hypothetical protein
MQRPMSEIFGDARRRKLPRDGLLVNTMRLAGTLLIVVGFVVLFIGAFS